MLAAVEAQELAMVATHNCPMLLATEPLLTSHLLVAQLLVMYALAVTVSLL